MDRKTTIRNCPICGGDINGGTCARCAYRITPDDEKAYERYREHIAKLAGERDTERDRGGGRRESRGAGRLFLAAYIILILIWGAHAALDTLDAVFSHRYKSAVHETMNVAEPEAEAEDPGNAPGGREYDGGADFDF